MSQQREYRFTKIQFFSQNIPIRKNVFHIKNGIPLLSAVFGLCFIAVFATCIAVGLAIGFCLILFFKKLAKQRNGQHITKKKIA